MLGVVVIWAVNYPIAKYGLGGLDALVFNSLRFIVASVVLSLPFAFGVQWKRVERRDLAELFRAGVIGSVIYQLVFIAGLSMTTAGNASVLLSTAPLWTVFIHARMHREKIRPQLLAGMAVSLCGIVMIIIGSGKKLEFGGSDIAGDLITLTAAALWGLTTNLQKPLLVRYSAPQLALFLILVGAAGLTIIAIPSAVSLPWGSIHWTYYAAAIASGTLTIGISSIIWAHGVHRLGPGRAANFHNLVPVLAFIISYLTLHEQLLPIQFVGAVATIAGVWIARR